MTDDNAYDLDARVSMPSLHDPNVANDALEAFLDADDRLSGGLAFLFCDEDGKLMQPILVNDLPTSITTEHRWEAMRWATNLCQMVAADQAGPLTLLLGVMRESGPICDEDREWHEIALAACHQADVRLIGMHVVTMERATAMPTITQAA